MVTIKKKIHLLTTFMIVLTGSGMLSLHFYDYWNLIVQNEFNKTQSMALLLDKQLEGTFDELLKETGQLDRREQVAILNSKLQPIIDKMSKSFPDYGAGYYSKKLNSIVAYGPEFDQEELRDLHQSHKARMVFITKKSYQFKDYSQTRDKQVIATIYPIIRQGEVIGLVWASIPSIDVLELFLKQMKSRILLLGFMLFVAYLGTRYITKQHEKSLAIFRKRVRNLDITEKESHEIMPEVLTIYQEVLDARKTIVENERKYQRDITDKILRAQEQERKRISRELHDGVGQWLFSILVTLKLLKEEKKNEIIKAEQIQTIEQLTKISMDEIKRIALDLRPASLDDLGLIPSIRSLIDRYGTTFQMKVVFEVKNKVKKLNPDLQTTLYRICQESLTNIAKYAKTDKVFITIGIRNEEVFLEIMDKGIGFQYLSEALNANGGLGLHGMEERTKLHGGTFKVISKLGEGTTILVYIPIEM
ncbi:histidine kinase [Bacillus sp. CGMCC 1.16607]|uniref:histidine kinase n=1 Tax=Bacillus sp. CGMCC 1.16607 TaxID=3351842 RepID=UPI003625BCF3